MIYDTEIRAYMNQQWTSRVKWKDRRCGFTTRVCTRVCCTLLMTCMGMSFYLTLLVHCRFTYALIKVSKTQSLVHWSENCTKCPDKHHCKKMTSLKAEKIKWSVPWVQYRERVKVWLWMIYLIWEVTQKNTHIMHAHFKHIKFQTFTYWAMLTIKWACLSNLYKGSLFYFIFFAELEIVLLCLNIRNHYTKFHYVM